MKTNIETIGKFLATAIWADGAYDEAEEITVAEIAEALELNKEELVENIKKAIEVVDDMDEDEVDQYLVEAAVDVDEEEAGPLYECALQIVLCDGVLSRDEITNLLTIGDALGIDPEDAMLMLCDMVKEEPELEIEF